MSEREKQQNFIYIQMKSFYVTVFACGTEICVKKRVSKKKSFRRYSSLFPALSQLTLNSRTIKSLNTFLRISANERKLFCILNNFLVLLLLINRNFVARLLWINEYTFLVWNYTFVHFLTKKFINRHHEKRFGRQ